MFEKPTLADLENELDYLEGLLESLQTGEGSYEEIQQVVREIKHVKEEIKKHK